MCQLLQLQLVLFLLLALSEDANFQLSPSSIAECPSGYSKSLHRRFDTCLFRGKNKMHDARILAYSYKCQDSRTKQLEFRNVLRVITNGYTFKGRFNMYIFTNDDERLQNYYSCIAFDRSEGLFLANFTTLLPADFYLQVNFELTAGYCHPDVI